MHRWFRMCVLFAVLAFTAGESMAQPVRSVSGTIQPTQVRVFVRDTLYQISGRLTVGGTLIIEPGTTVEFLPNGRLIDSVGGRIIADGRARAIYNSNVIPGSTPRVGGGFCYDYSDPAYFFSNLVVSQTTPIEPTISDSKRDITYNVVLDTLLRRIENLPAMLATPPTPGATYPRFPVAINPPAGAVPPPGTYFPVFNAPYSAATVVGGNSFFNTKFIVSYEYALMWINARLENPTADPLIRVRTWTRNNFQSPNIGGPNRDRIRFIGKAVNSFSREWGHIVILPGTRAAIFRDCEFENFRKDTTVSRLELYNTTTGGDPNANNTLNNNMNTLVNGSGGVLSILSSRTWLVNCTFTRNQARYHGGAVQFLQAPTDPSGQVYPTVIGGTGSANTQYNTLPASYSPADLGTAAGTGPIIVNQYLFEHFANNTSTQLQAPRVNADPNNPQFVRAHDNLYNASLREMDDNNRQAIDDGRLAMYLGRIRQLTFTQNRVQNANIAQITSGNNVVVTDDEANPATVEPATNRSYKNDAFGGAVYINGRWGIDVGLGVNDFQGRDYVIFDGNMARNLQQGTGTNGALGGALHVANSTALVTTGRYRSNMTETKFITNYTSAALNQGGAIYMGSRAGRLTLRGGQDVIVPMHLTNNSAARGGAIYVAENFAFDPNRPSPHIGGNNGNNIQVRNLGYNIKLLNNTATYDGGALFTQRNYLIYGAGGVINNTLLGGGYTPATLVELNGNTAGWSGGAIAIHMRSNVTEPERGYVRLVRASFDNNRVGENITGASRDSVRGGGAVYSLNAELQTVQGTLFRANLAQFGNGGAIAIVNPKPSFAGGPSGSFQRVIATDLDEITYSPNNAFITGFRSENGVFTFDPTVTSQYPAHVGMLTRFWDNRAVENANRMGNGTSQTGNVGNIFHPGTGATSGPDANVGGNRLIENGTGLGGAIYIVDEITANRAGRIDSLYFNRVRIQNQTAYSGSAIYSDNYDLKLVLQRSLIANNTATSSVGSNQNAITGPRFNQGSLNINQASSDLAGTTIYGEAVGPVPFNSYSIAGNSIYDNNARFLIRLPDAPNTKGNLAGTTGIGYGGVDTLRGNYWGRTEANVTTKVYRFDTNNQVSDSVDQETFFVAGNGTQLLRFVRGGAGLNQGPFEFNSNGNANFNYTPIPVLNGADENTANAQSIPERFLQQGHVYDVFDKGLDIKTADYAERRMSPIEDFAVGIPTRLSRFTNANQPSFNRFVKRYTRDPFVAEQDQNIARLQTEFKGNHPIGYPLFLEAQADYTTLNTEFSNNDIRSINETVFFVINTNTGDYIRVNMSQVDLTSETFRARVDIVPDSSNGGQVVGGYAVRRNAEGLANFGTDLSSVLAALKRNATNEDLGVLKGRKYEASTVLNELGNSPGGNGFSVGRTLPASNGGDETYFAGERYRAIPAKNGDQLAIVSRSALWREVGSNNDAFAGALIFNVGLNTPAPVWTGNQLTTANPVQIDANGNVVRDINGNPVLVPAIMRNLMFVSEDTTYPRNRATRVPFRDTIFAITARDTNLFHDPRAILNPESYTQLDYSWNVDPNSGLAMWLEADTVRANNTQLNPWYQAVGYIRLKGRATNPYVVPGGEVVNVFARNYPPTLKTIDSMKKAGYADSVIAKYIYLYPSYFANGSYDNTNARFLQQDTVNFGNGSQINYQFRVFVTNHPPVVTNVLAPCRDLQNPNRLFANLTDKLRFMADVQTNDELEDSIAQTKGWTFPYGRTSYGFRSVNQSGSDTTADGVSQIRPFWLSNSFLRKYADAAQNDNFAVDFTSKGQLRVSIDAAEAIRVLSPLNRVNGSLNTDTVMTIAVNDGHGGVTYLTRQIVVNVAPIINNQTLPDAFEDQDYSTFLSSIDKVITVSDANFGQRQRFELIRANDQRKAQGIPRDNCYSEAGTWDITNADTPEWLKINQESGMLYGTPRVRDARLPDTTVKVTVLVTDEGGLTHVKTLDLVVKGINHNPDITGLPAVRCVENNTDIEIPAELEAGDVDLERNETIQIRVIEPAGLTITSPANGTVTGPRTSTRVPVTIGGRINVTPYRTSVDVKVVVTDANGGTPDTAVFKVNVSEPTTFTSRLRIQNNKGAFETLTWGSATKATTGDNITLGGLGKLDSNYCEYELPPIPPLDIFDARWTVPSKTGMLYNVFPSCNAGTQGIDIYKGRFQAGSVNGDNSEYFPVRISWLKSSVPAPSNTQLNPCGGTYFLRDAVGGVLYNINMAAGAGRTEGSGNYELVTSGDTVTLIIKRDAVNSFVILWDKATPVDEQPVAGELGYSLTSINPNPTNGSATNISFSLPGTSRVKIEIYDNLGSRIATVADGIYSGANNTVTWNGTDAASGHYTVRMTSGSFSTVAPLLIVK